MIVLNVCSRVEAEEKNELGDPHVIISISTPGDSVPSVKKNNHTRGVIYLQFHDLDKEPGPVFRQVYGDPVLFTARDAQQIVAFVLQWMERGIRLYRVHCDAGQSRSVAVAAALAKHFNGEDREWWGTPGMYASARSPNRHIYRTMLGALEP